MKTQFFLLLVLTMVSLGTKGQGKEHRVDPAEGLKFTVGIHPQEFHFSNIDDVRVSVEVENQGTKSVDPRVYDLTLLINGEHSYGWSLTMGNGLRPAKWYDLPPGEEVSMEWPTLAKSLFPEPGSYHLEFKRGEKTVQVLDVDCKDK